MVLTKGKRFIKKVPPSGVAPVFKLTLPHSVVHTHMHHLIDAEFDIATSSTAPQTWHGRISPRRNKSRSEYTLQGWRLFAEALGVVAGDQVSFELVNRRRLVVRIIKTADGRPLEDGSVLRSSPSPSAFSGSFDEPARPSPQLQALQPVSAEDDTPWSNLASVCGFGTAQGDSAAEAFATAVEPVSQPVAEHPKATFLEVFDPWQQDVSAQTIANVATDAAETPVGQNTTSDSLDSESHFLMQLASPSHDAVMDLPSVDDAMGGLLTEKEPASLQPQAASGSRSDSGSELELQLFSLNTMLRRLQSEARDYQNRAVKAETELTRVRAAVNKLKESADQHTRGMLRAGSGIEAAIRKLQAPEVLSPADLGSTDATLAIRSEVMQHTDVLKACIWGLLNASN